MKLVDQELERIIEGLTSIVSRICRLVIRNRLDDEQRKSISNELRKLATDFEDLGK